MKDLIQIEGVRVNLLQFTYTIDTKNDENINKIWAVLWAKFWREN